MGLVRFSEQLLASAVGSASARLILSLLFNAPLEEFFSLQTWLLAIVGSIVVLLIYGAIVGRKS